MISLLVPSKGRPDFLEKAIHNFKEYSNSETEILVFLTKSDPELPKYLNIKCIAKKQVCYYVDELDSLPKKYNYLSKIAKGSCLVMAADDMEIRTKGWEKVIIQAIPEHGIAVMATNRDAAHGIPHPIVTRKWLEALGYMANPAFWHLYCDSWISELAESAGLLIDVPEVEFLHHKQKGKWQKRRLFHETEDMDTRKKLEEEFQATVKRLRSMI